MGSMKRMLGIGVCAMTLTAPAHAALITFGGDVAADGSGLTTSVVGATVFDFNTGKPASYTGAGSVVNFSVPGGTAAPAGDATPYLSVAYPAQSGVATLSLGGSYNYFGLYWGSIDDYNTLSFYNGASLVEQITGLQVIQAGTQLGDQTAPGSNRYVNLLFSNATFDRVDFGTTTFAFESDNHAVANVPEPGTLGLLGLGLLAVGIARRRKS